MAGPEHRAYLISDSFVGEESPARGDPHSLPTRSEFRQNFDGGGSWIDSETGLLIKIPVHGLMSMDFIQRIKSINIYPCLFLYENIHPEI